MPVTRIEFRASIAPIMSGIRTGSDGLRLTLDVPESDVQDAVALIALRNIPLRITVELDESPVATKLPQPKQAKQLKEANPFGAYWHEWFRPDAHGAKPIYAMLLLDALNLDGEPATQDTVHDALKAALGVFSLSREASPEVFEAWLSERHLEGLATQSRRITAKLREAKAS